MALVRLLPALYIVIACMLCIINIASALEGEDINFFCKTQCIDRGGTIGKCNALCSTKSDTGAMTKDANGLSTCMRRTDETAYNCYSLCDTAGNTVGNGVSQPSPDNSDADRKK